MHVRIRFPRGRPLNQKAGKNRQAALAFGALLGPACLMAYVLGLWRLASDLGFAGEFGISGFFSHWQLWIGLAVAMHVASITLSRYGRGGELEVPKVLTVFPRPESEREPEEPRVG